MQGLSEALKTEAAILKHRREATSGETSTRKRPEHERIRLEGLATQPIVTEAEFERVHRLIENQRLRSKEHQAPPLSPPRQGLLVFRPACFVVVRQAHHERINQIRSS